MIVLKDIKQTMSDIAHKAIENIELYTTLDGLSGDGDLGDTIKYSTDAILAHINTSQEKDIGKFLFTCGVAMNKAAPSTLGTLLATSVMQLGKTFKGYDALSDEDISRIPKLMGETISSKGGAVLGDKTILDALIPMGDKVYNIYTTERDIKRAYHEGAKEAIKGAQNTAGMIPKAGRAQWIGERVKDNLDGGAMVCATIAELFIE